MKFMRMYERKIGPARKLCEYRNNIFGGGYNVRFSDLSEIIFPVLFLRL